MNWSVALSSRRPRVAILVSKYDRCLVDLLYRQRGGELACDFPLIISNHPDTKHHAETFTAYPSDTYPSARKTKRRLKLNSCNYWRLRRLI